MKHSSIFHFSYFFTYQLFNKVKSVIILLLYLLVIDSNYAQTRQVPCSNITIDLFIDRNEKILFSGTLPNFDPNNHVITIYYDNNSSESCSLNGTGTCNNGIFTFSLDENGTFTISLNQCPKSGVDYITLMYGRDSMKYCVTYLNDKDINIVGIPEGDIAVGSTVTITLDPCDGIKPINCDFNDNNCTLKIEPVTKGGIQLKCTIQSINECKTETIDKLINVVDQESNSKPVDVIFLIDVSGSMGERGSCSNSNEENPNSTKLDYIKENLAGIYGKMFDLNKGTESRFGLVTFADNAMELKFNNSFFNKFDAVSIGDFKSTINNLKPTTMTNMGAGLLLAINKLSNPNDTNQKQIILITNGMQNQNPYVRKKSNGKVFFDNDRFDVIPSGINIFSIAVFQPDANYIDLLKSISTNARFTDVCNIKGTLDEAFEATYAKNSPKIVGVRTGNFPGNTTTINYSIYEKEFDKVVFTVASNNISQISYTVQKNINGTWIDIGAGGYFVDANPNYKIYSIDGLPKMVNNNYIVPQGEYRLIASSSAANVDYYSSAIIDDRGLKTATFIEKNTFKSGDQIGLSTRLRYGGNLLSVNDAVVKAVIHRPVLSFDKQFSREKIPAGFVSSKHYYTGDDKRESARPSVFRRFDIRPATGSQFEPNLPLIEQKFQVVVQEKNFLSKLRYETDTILLPHVTNGIYRADYANTRVTGVYDVEYLINGEITSQGGIGKFFRTERHSTPVLFGKPDRSKSKLYLYEEDGRLFISLLPVDTFGNYLGMGKRNQIQVSMSSGSVGGAIDYLNGRYVIPVTIKENENPYIIIRISGMKLYSGDLLNISPRRWSFSVNGQYNYPAGRLDSIANPGFGFSVQLGYRLGRKYTVLAEGGYFGFAKAATDGERSDIYGGAVGIAYSPVSFPNSGGMRLQIEATGGYYKQYNASDGFWGVRSGFEVVKPIKTWFALSAGAHYYYMNTLPDPLNFLSTTFSAIFTF